MNKMDELFIALKIVASSFTYDLFHDEEGAVGLIEIVVLIGIAVVLALLFKEQITSLLTTLLSTITGKAQDAVN